MKPAIAKVSKTISTTFFNPLQGVISLLLVKIQVRRNNIALKNKGRKRG